MNEELNTLDKLFSELLAIVKKNGGSEYISQISTIESILSCLRDNEFTDTSKMEYVVSRHRELYPPRGGLSEFFIWDNDFQTRKRLNKPLDTVRDDIWAILKKYRA
ncbi:hypothetical protein HBP99_15910 [Listeria booriae]|uniref:hypothetical protein n=1 Tax=Listeria booriae TaxID=1552123 RepID=UPI0016276A26|nr:hypothetical protein [Listeria booriae]MBC2370116.1 hypothetical protein [Listeria booriae]